VSDCVATTAPQMPGAGGPSSGGSVVSVAVTRRTPTEWPKTVPELSPTQRLVEDDWMRHWLEVLPSKHGRVEHFNHEYPKRAAPPGGRTLEIGPGLGGHARHEDLSVQEYHAVELRPELADALRAELPDVHVVAADCQERLPYDDAYFDRVLAIHVLEHLPDLPRALAEVRRVLKPGGRFAIVIPCEGGRGYALGRRLTVQRLFERRYGMPYTPHIEADHCNRPHEILEELRKVFGTVDTTYWPVRVPIVDVNLLIGASMVRD
jgi:SAM-dependent methyltransferase